MSEEKSKITKAQQRAVAKYVKNNYDEIKIRVPKGRKSEIKNHADNMDESVNQFISRAITVTMAHDIVDSFSVPSGEGYASAKSHFPDLRGLQLHCFIAENATNEQYQKFMAGVTSPRDTAAELIMSNPALRPNNTYTLDDIMSLVSRKYNPNKEEK